MLKTIIFVAIFATLCSCTPISTEGLQMVQFDPEAVFRAGLDALQQFDGDTAFPLLKQAADANFPPAANFYGHMLFEGTLGLPEDKVSALTYFKSSALQGDSEGGQKYHHAIQTLLPKQGWNPTVIGEGLDYFQRYLSQEGLSHHQRVKYQRRSVILQKRLESLNDREGDQHIPRLRFGSDKVRDFFKELAPVEIGGRVEEEFRQTGSRLKDTGFEPRDRLDGVTLDDRLKFIPGELVENPRVIGDYEDIPWVGTSEHTMMFEENLERMGF